MNRYLNEMSRILRKLGFATHQKDDDNVQVFYEGKQLCLLHSKGFKYYREDINSAERESILSMVKKQHNFVSEYTNAYEKAPPLVAEGLDKGFRLLSEFNRTVFAVKDLREYGYQFVTWERTYGDTGLTLGHYMHDYEAAKKDFAIRAGLISEHAVFGTEQLTKIYRALDYFKNENPDITFNQEEALKELMQKTEYALPDAEIVLNAGQSDIDMEL